MNANLTLYLPQVPLNGRPNPAGSFLAFLTLRGSFWTFANPAGQFLDDTNPAGQFLDVRNPARQFLDVPNPAGRFLDVSSFKTLISQKLSLSVIFFS